MKKLLFFDTETNGLPRSFSAKISDTTNWPRVTQLAWELCWGDGTTIHKHCDYIIPDDWTVPTSNFFLEQGITTELLKREGVPMDALLHVFLKDLEKSDLIISHNMAFDKPVISCEMVRYGLRPGKTVPTYCTKLESKYICKIKSGSFADYKWPSLKEAYTFFYGKMPEGAHKADFDVDICKKVYFAIENEKLL